MVYPLNSWLVLMMIERWMILYIQVSPAMFNGL